MPALGPWIRVEVLEGPQRSLAFTYPGLSSSLVVTTGGGEYLVRPADRHLAQAEVDPVETFLAIAGRLEATDPFVRELSEGYRPI